MATRKRSRRQPTGRPRGRPRKDTKPDPAVDITADGPLQPSPFTVDGMIQAATEAPAPDSSAALEALADKIEQQARDDTPVYSGPVRSPAGSSSDKAVAQLSQQVAGLAVVLFGLVALWRGDEWQVTEDEAGLIGDATAESYAEDAAALARQVKWVAPLTALVGIVGQKVLAEVERRKRAEQSATRIVGTAPADGTHA